MSMRGLAALVCEAHWGTASTMPVIPASYCKGTVMEAWPRVTVLS